MPSRVLAVLVGEVFFGGVVIFRFVGLDVEGVLASFEGDLGSMRNIFLVSGSVRTLIGDIWVGSRRGEDRLALGVAGGVPRSDSGAASFSAMNGAEVEEAREGEDSSTSCCSAIIRSTSPSSGVRSLVLV